ncbi:hypothetical protein AgCh_029327 [Apium graveolens]
MPFLIPGPNDPTKDFHVYLRPLIDELKMLWRTGVQTYDRSSGINFMMKAALIWTISNFAALGMLSGWSTKGKLSCPDEVILTAKARKPKKGRAFLHSRHTLNEILGANQARALIGSNIQSHIQNNTSQSAPPENQTYSIMLRAMREMTVLVNSMDGMTEVPRSYLDEQLRLLATGAYPYRTNPIQAALWDQYVQLAGDMAANLLQTYNKVITEGTRVEKAPVERNPFEDDDVDLDADNYPLQ